MSAQLRQFLMNDYENRRTSPYARKIDAYFPIQLDDQDDDDNLNEFCNIFCFVHKNDCFSIEISGSFPITDNISDLVDIYNGSINRELGRLIIRLKTSQIEAIMDLADRIRKTALMGKLVSNSSWLSLSARTISSLYRFVRLIKEYNQFKLTRHLLTG